MSAALQPYYQRGLLSTSLGWQSVGIAMMACVVRLEGIDPGPAYYW